MTGIRTCVVAGIALALATPAHAQAVTSAYGPEDDLRCAAWSAIVMGLNEGDPEIASAFGMALTWFVARYEGATGKPFEQAMTPDYLDGLTPDLEAIEQACRPRMLEMGQRFTDWGSTLQAAGN